MVCEKTDIARMVICFEATTEAKRALDALLGTGQFRDISEAVSMALVNYQVIQRAMSKGGEMVMGSAPIPVVEELPASRAESQTPPPPPAASQPRGPIIAAAAGPEIPELFVLKSTNLEGLNLLPVPTVPNGAETNLPPARWLFGQYNKFLPVKAACRALLNLQRKAPAGVPLNEATSQIAYAACGLGDSLKALDDRQQLRREDAFAAAFPSSASGSEGSRLRFGSQFVAGIRQDQLDGLPAALRLVALEKGKEPRLCLTRAGAEFAVLANPVLDDQATFPATKFSEVEVNFLLAHIRQVVPEEVSAYVAIIAAIQNGSNTPDSVDVYLRQRFKLPDEADISKTFLTTQRTGAISRMVDLGLVAREKTGLRVTYSVSSKGQCFQS